MAMTKRLDRDVKDMDSFMAQQETTDPVFVNLKRPLKDVYDLLNQFRDGVFGAKCLFDASRQAARAAGGRL